MSSCGSTSATGGLEVLLKAATFIEEQEKLRQQTSVIRVSSGVDEKELLVPVSTSHNVLLPPTTTCRNHTSQFLSLPRHGSIIREAHNKKEKNRKAHLRDCFDMLRKQLPPIPDTRKFSNINILDKSVGYIAFLSRKGTEYEDEIKRLTYDKSGYQKKISYLKKELATRWKRIDYLNTLLPVLEKPEARRVSGSFHSDSVAQQTQAVNSSGPPFQQLLPLTSIRLLPSDTHFVDSQIPSTNITIQNTVLNRGTVTSATKHQIITKGSSPMTSGLLNHSVEPKPSCAFSFAASTQISDKVMTTPVLKNIIQIPIQHQFLVKPRTVIFSSSDTTPK